MTGQEEVGGGGTLHASRQSSFKGERWEPPADRSVLEGPMAAVRREGGEGGRGRNQTFPCFLFLPVLFYYVSLLLPFIFLRIFVCVELSCFIFQSPSSFFSPLNFFIDSLFYFSTSPSFYFLSIFCLFFFLSVLFFKFPAFYFLRFLCCPVLFFTFFAFISLRI